jgi:hypothetical protein
MSFGGTPYAAAPLGATSGQADDSRRVTIAAVTPLPVASLALDHGVHFDIVVSATTDAPISGMSLRFSPAISIGILSSTPAPSAALSMRHSMGVRIAASTPVPTAALAILHDWSNTATVLRQTPIYIMEMIAPGQTAIRIPISNFQGRLRDGSPSWMQVTIPNAPHWSEAVIARAAGQLVLYSGVRFGGGLELLEEIARVNIERIEDARGGRSQTIAVSGHSTATNAAPRIRTMHGVTYRSSGSGQRRYRCRLDRFLRPGDTAVIPSYGEQITVGLITYVVDSTQTTMEITEA